MDIVTHALLGALTAATAAPERAKRSNWALVGGVGALLPDLDVLIRSSDDPLLVLEYHRHFTHSLFFAPFGAVVGTALLWPFFRRCLNLKALYIACLIGYISACLLDVCTSYGTHLLWPALPQPLALGIIAVVDPLFSLLMGVGLVLCLWRGHGRLHWFGVVAGGLYLCFGALQLHRAQEAASRWTETDNIRHDKTAISQLLVKPTLGNLLLWRALIIRDNQVQALGLRVGLFGKVVNYPGESTTLIDLPKWQRRLSDSRAYGDLLRFNRFANGLLVVFPGEPNRIGDIRYAMLPTSVAPLWGIEVDEQHPDHAPRFFTQRDTRPEIRATFVRMLTGRPLVED